MKTYENFSSDDFKDDYILNQDTLERLTNTIHKDLFDNGFKDKYTKLSFNSFNENFVEENGKIKYIPLSIRIEIDSNNVKVDIDVVEYFNMIKNTLSKYGYHKMTIGKSTNYYDILLDWDFLLNSNIFKSLQGKIKFNI